MLICCVVGCDVIHFTLLIYISLYSIALHLYDRVVMFTNLSCAISVLPYPMSPGSLLSDPILSYTFLSHLITSYSIIAYPFISYPILSHSILSYYILLHLLQNYLTLFYPILSCPALFCLILFFHTRSYPDLS